MSETARPAPTRVRCFILTSAALTVLGVPLGLIWSVIAPRAVYVVTSHGNAMVADVETTAYIADDGWFAVIAVATALVAAVVSYRSTGLRNPVASLVGLALGGTLGSIVAWKVGQAIDVGRFHHSLRTGAPGQHLQGYLTLHAHGVLILEPLMAVAAFGLIEALATRDRDKERSA